MWVWCGCLGDGGGSKRRTEVFAITPKSERETLSEPDDVGGLLFRLHHRHRGCGCVWVCSIPFLLLCRRSMCMWDMRGRKGGGVDHPSNRSSSN